MINLFDEFVEYPPALLIKLPAVQEDYVPSCRLGLLDREREDGEISDLRLDTKSSNTR